MLLVEVDRGLIVVPATRRAARCRLAGPAKSTVARSSFQGGWIVPSTVRLR